MKPLRLIRRHEVENRVGLKRSSIYQLMKDGDFPKPIKIMPGAVAWLETDIDRWINTRVAGAGA